MNVREVREVREGLGLSAESFGRLLGVSAWTVQRWESGRTCPGARDRAVLQALRQALADQAAARRLVAALDSESPLRVLESLLSLAREQEAATAKD